MAVVGLGWSFLFLSGQKVMAATEYCGSSLTSDSPKVNTALGCLPVKFSDLMALILPYFFGIVGGISFLLMVYGFILMATSSGDPKAVAGAKETITSAITGLLISMFAVFIIKLIGYDILHIPGL